MASLVVNDLSEDRNLDRDAMRAITGGNPGLRLTGSGGSAIPLGSRKLEESALIPGLIKTRDLRLRWSGLNLRS